MKRLVESLRWVTVGTLLSLCGLYEVVPGLESVALADSSSGWNTSYGNSYPDYYSPPTSYGSNGRSGKAAVISIDLDPQNLMNSSFRVASREGRMSDVEHLLSEGAEVDGRSDTGETALMYAARNCSSKLAKFLILHGANINAADFDGKTPLILASRESCTDVVALLLKGADIDVDAQDQARKTAFDYAGENAVLEVGGPSQKIMGMIEAIKKRIHVVKRKRLS